MENEIKYIMIPGLEKSAPAHLTPPQQALQPYAFGIEALWWIIWAATISYVATRFVILPFFRKITTIKK